MFLESHTVALLTIKSENHRIGWWEILQESPIFDGKIHGFRLRFSLKPIQWEKDNPVRVTAINQLSQQDNHLSIPSEFPWNPIKFPQQITLNHPKIIQTFSIQLPSTPSSHYPPKIPFKSHNPQNCAKIPSVEPLDPGGRRHVVPGF